MKTKQLDIELMRVLAAFFVIFNHTENYGFFLFSMYHSHSLQFWVYMFLSIFCKFSVSLFFMIAGALILDREIVSYRGFFRKKILRMILILVFWSAVYYAWYLYEHGEKASLLVFLSRLYSSEWCYAFWYLYAYLAFLLIAPVLQRIAKQLSDKEYLYLFILSFFICSILPTIEYLLFKDQYHLNGSFNLSWLSSSLFICPLLGYFVRYRTAGFWNKKRLGILWMVNIAAIMLSCYLTYREAQITGVLLENVSERFHTTFVLLNCLMMFVTCQYFTQNVNISDFLQKTILSLGGATFGVYLMHVLVLKVFEKLQVIEWLYKILDINYMLTALIYCAAVFAVAYLGTQVCKKIPGLKLLVS